MRYLRFVVASKSQDSGVREGLFQVAGRLAKSRTLSEPDQERLDELRAWFGEHLAVPDRFTRTRNASHKKTRGVSWFKDSAHEYVRRMRELAAVLHEHGIAVDVIETLRPGYVTYEDEAQVVAEPFADTRV
jgi:hypothetical protein